MISAGNGTCSCNGADLYLDRRRKAEGSPEDRGPLDGKRRRIYGRECGDFRSGVSFKDSFREYIRGEKLKVTEDRCKEIVIRQDRDDGAVKMGDGIYEDHNGAWAEP